MNNKLSFEELNDLFDDNLSANECESYIERLFDNHQQNEFNKLIKIGELVSLGKNPNVPVQLLNFDVSSAVVETLSQNKSQLNTDDNVNSEAKGKHNTESDSRLYFASSHEKNKSNNVISVLFKRPLINFAIAASILFVVINVSVLLSTNDTLITNDNTIAQYSDKAVVQDLELQQQLVVKDIHEQERQLQETLLKHRLLQQGFFPSDFHPGEQVSSQTSKLAKTVSWQEHISSQENDNLPINFYHQANTVPHLIKISSE
ncbi:MAG: hypothetical protein HQL46_11800 [Gammaproteobacteria bacterium]|nr:hypothetical protein [Gammaproteobacteria bacterium]